MTAPPGLIRHWDFTPSAPSPKIRLSRLWRDMFHRQPGPAWKAIRSITPAPHWAAYFVYAPDGALAPHHRYTIDKLRLQADYLAIIYASDRPMAGIDVALSQADAVYWKALSGFDFSAYAILIAEAARQSPGCDLIMMNDSVLGPFNNLIDCFRTAPWRLSGLTGYSLVENHVQSYAFCLRKVDDEVSSLVGKIASQRLSFSRFGDVVLCQETRFASTLAKQVDVGALWSSDHRRGGGDLPLVWPFGLLDEGFPFLKRSLFGKFGAFHDRAVLDEFLASQCHPSFGK